MEQKNDKVEIRKSIEADTASLSPRLRKEDAAEVFAAGFHSVHDCLEYGRKNSMEVYTVLLGGIPIGMFGVRAQTFLGMEAVVWFLGSPEMAKIKKTFMKMSKFFINDWLKRYPILWNLVPISYKQSVSWLHWLGASFGNKVCINSQEFVIVMFMRGV